MFKSHNIISFTNESSVSHVMSQILTMAEEAVLQWTLLPPFHLLINIILFLSFKFPSTFSHIYLLLSILISVHFLGQDKWATSRKKMGKSLEECEPQVQGRAQESPQQQFPSIFGLRFVYTGPGSKPIWDLTNGLVKCIIQTRLCVPLIIM